MTMYSNSLLTFLFSTAPSLVIQKQLSEEAVASSQLLIGTGTLLGHCCAKFFDFFTVGSGS